MSFFKSKDGKIPLWINIFQGLLILIMLSQVYIFYLNHAAVTASGITIQSIADYNLVYEFGARTLTMALVSIFIMIFQNIKMFIALFFMNIVREVQETIIDPMFPLANAPTSPTMDIVIHLVIVAFEVIAFIQLIRMAKRLKSGS